MALLDRHIGFVEALRTAGLPVSLSEDLDSVAAVDRLGLADREAVRAACAATLVKRQVHRATFDVIFDLYFPPMLGHGVRHESAAAHSKPLPFGEADEEVVRTLRDQLLQAMLAEDERQLRALAVESVEQLGAM